MHTEFLPDAESKILKALGFDVPTIAAYWDDKMVFAEKKDHWDRKSDYNYYTNKETRDVWCIAPLWQQVEEWLWEKQEINIEQKLLYINEGRIYTEVFHKGLSVWFFQHTFKSSNPILAKREAIQAAINYLKQSK